MKKWISLLLALCLVAGVMPTAAFAEDMGQKMDRVLPDYPAGSEIMDPARYKVLGSWLISYARNPSLKVSLNELLKKTAGGEMVTDESFGNRTYLKPARVPDLSQASEAAQAAAGEAIGLLICSCARNPSQTRILLEQSYYFGLAEPWPKEEWPKDLPEGEDPTVAGFRMLPLDVTREGFQIAKAQAMGDLLIGYAYNPSMKDDLIKLYEQAFGAGADPVTVTPAIRAAWLRAVSGYYIACARNPSLDRQREGSKPILIYKDLFNRYSPIPYDELASADTDQPEVQAAQMENMGAFLIGYAYNPSVRERLEETYNTVVPEQDSTPLAQRDPLVQAAAAQTMGNMMIAYARNPSLYLQFVEYLAKVGLTEPVPPEPTPEPAPEPGAEPGAASEPVQNYRYLQPDLSLPEVQKARMNAAAACLFAYARNPSLKNHLIGLLARTLGGYSAVPAPYTAQWQAEQNQVLEGMMLSVARNPALLDRLLEIAVEITLPPLPLGEGYTIDFETDTLTVLEGYTVQDKDQTDLGQTLDLRALTEQGIRDLRILGPLHAAGFRDREETIPLGRARTGQLALPDLFHGESWPAAPTEQPTVQSVGRYSVILEPAEPYVTKNNGENRVQYSCDGGRTWQDSNEFTGLDSSTTYTFAMRYGGRRFMDRGLAGGEREPFYSEPLPPSPAGPTLDVTTKSRPRPRPRPRLVDRTELADGSVTETFVNPDGSRTAVTTAPDGGRTTVKTDPGGNVTIQAAPSAPGVSTRVLIPAESVKPGQAAVIVHPDGTEEIVRKSAAGADGIYLMVDEPVEVKIMEFGKHFADTDHHWAADAVAYVTCRKLFSGVSDVSFAPDAAMTRGMLAQVIYNLEGSPDTDAIENFCDVTDEDWFTMAVAWAASQGIVSGYPNGSFGGEERISREQAAVMLYNYAGRPAAASGELNFSDADQISGYALPAISWAVQNGIMSGDGTELNPRDNATRAEAAAMLMNFVNHIYS